jgi:GWxTD domain-containing protein
MQQRIRARAGVALAAVRRASGTDAGRVPEVQLLRGRLERLTGEPDSALAAFDRYLALGGDSGVGQLQRARSLFRLGRSSQARSAYYRGAEQAASPAARALYREDLSWVATPEELDEFDQAEPAALRSWLEDFWHTRDAHDARASGERLAEHYRRYFHALERYRLVSRHRRYDVSNPYRNEQRTFDDRGIVYLRHGEPTRVAVHNDPGVDPNESWLYIRPDDDLVFHFVARGDVQDYKLVESVADVLGMDTAIALQARGLTTPAAEALFASRVHLAPVYQRLAGGQVVGRDRLLASERSAGARSIRTGTSTDSYPLRFERPLGSTVQQYVVGRPGGGAQMLVVFAVPGEGLTAEVAGGSLTYALDARIIAATRGDSVAAFLDTTLVYAARRRLGGEQHLTDVIELPLPPGRYDVQVVLAQPGGSVGDLSGADSVDVPDFGAGGLLVSDLIVGSAGSGLSWVGAGDTVDLSPLGHYPATAELTVYYQIHGLERGAGYRARLEIRKEGGGSVFGFIKRLFGGGGPQVSLSFEGVAIGPLTAVSQQVDASELSPGRYRMRLEIEDLAGGRMVERERMLEIAES